MTTLYDDLQNAKTLLMPESHGQDCEFNQNAQSKSIGDNYARNLSFLIDEIEGNFYGYNTEHILKANIDKAKHIMQQDTPYCDIGLLHEVIALVKNNTDTQDPTLREKTKNLLNYFPELDEEQLSAKIEEMKNRVRDFDVPASQDIIANYYGFYSTQPNPEIKTAVEKHHQQFKDVMVGIIDQIESKLDLSPSSDTNHHQQGRTHQP